MRTRPSVLLITIDQWRADSLGCAGHPLARTPNLDALAARGVRFARHYAQATPCGPSRASLLTGTYLHTHRSGSNGTPLDDRFTNLAREMNRSGYHSTLFGYTDTSPDPRTIADPSDRRLFSYEGVMPGFDAEVNLPEHLEPWGEWLREHGYDIEPGRVPETMYRQEDLDPTSPYDPPTVYRAEHSEGAFLAECYGDWLDRQDNDDALFAHLTFIRPHPPFMAPAPWNELVDPALVPMPTRHESPEAEGAEHPLVAGALLVDIARCPDDDNELRRLRATYWSMVAEVDHQFGVVQEHLERTGRADDTMVIVTADHGEQLGDHWFIQKLGFFESSYHIPLIVAGPVVVESAAGTVVDEFTENVDLMPTVLDVVGLDIPRQCEGASLVPFLRGESPASWRDAAHWEWDFRDPLAAEMIGARLDQCNLAVMRTRTAKYVHFAGMSPAFYDLVADPGELHNLAADPVAMSDPSVARAMLEAAQAMLSWRMSHDDQTLASWRITDDGPQDLADPPR